MNRIISDGVIRALNEIGFILSANAAGDPVFHRWRRIRELELHLSPTEGGSWRARLRARHPGGPWEWVSMEGLTTNGGLELEVSASQLNGSFPLLLDKHIIPYADRTAFGE